MTVTEKHYSKCSVFAFGFETRTKTILPLINRLINLALLVADPFQSDAAHWRPPLVSDKRVPACRFQSVSPGAGALVWFSCSQGWKWMVHRTIVMSCCSNSCCQTSVKLLATFAFQRTTCAHCARALSCCDTRLRTSHQTWTPNRPDLSSVGYRLLGVIQACIYQKQQGTSNIVNLNLNIQYSLHE